MIAEWINFGQVSAERDENLSKYFFDNGVLQSVIGNRHQFLVLGRKGAGKTAVFQHLSDNPDKYLSTSDSSVNLYLQNYSWNVHGLLATEGKAYSLAYIHSWKYIVYLFAVRKLIEAGVKTKKLDAARKIIQRVYTSPTPGLGEVIGRRFLQLSKLRLPGENLV
jgi:ABC-type branched-subunit amino acid transport system ATPase component